MVENAGARIVAEPEPNIPCSLLVPSAATGGKPARSNAGMVIRPPPPAIESTKPAAKAAVMSIKTVCKVRSIIGLGGEAREGATASIMPD